MFLINHKGAYLRICIHSYSLPYLGIALSAVAECSSSRHYVRPFHSSAGIFSGIRVTSESWDMLSPVSRHLASHQVGRNQTLSLPARLGVLR